MLFAQIITINFAVVVAIYYFLDRAPILFRLAAFAFYAIGMLYLVLRCCFCLTLAVDVVTREPLSAGNCLLAGIIAGNFAKIPAPGPEPPRVFLSFAPMRLKNSRDHAQGIF